MLGELGLPNPALASFGFGLMLVFEHLDKLYGICLGTR